jgi:hypothetical protein
LARIRGFNHDVSAERSFARTAATGKKKADVAEHPTAFDHVGLLINEPPGSAELPFI